MTTDMGKWEAFRESVLSQVEELLRSTDNTVEPLDPVTARFTGHLMLDSGRSYFNATVDTGEVGVFADEDEDE